MMGYSVKEANKAVRKALKEETATLQFMKLRTFCFEQAHRLDGDVRCMACNKWITEAQVDDAVWDVDGMLCPKCGKEERAEQCQEK